ncbi:cryptochrome/photolyase family protein [Pelagibacteraceae bacterium]|nr:cryptochrome/photolyase family protein [Pelagibacteraceae bacterium]
MTSSKGFLSLGNQLFSKEHIKDYKKHHFFMAEDYGLCTYEKHHKQKILLFLSAMRSYAEELSAAKYQVTYYDCNHPLFKKSYETKLLEFIKKNSIKEIVSFEVEDKFLEKRLHSFFLKNKVSYQTIKSPMFVTTRKDFTDYLQSNKKPFMATFYKLQRTKMNVLIKDKNKPVGGKWSFDEENRKKLPKVITIPKVQSFKISEHTKKLKPFIEKIFSSHPGTLDSFNHPTTRKDAIKLYLNFLKEKFALFGDYEDSMTVKSHAVFHSMLSPIINLGLITPTTLIRETLDFAKANKIPLNSLEGYVRQIIGWREFMRGIYQNYEKRLLNTNFFNHQRKLNKSWYDGTTGIVPLDHAIKNCLQFGYTHHIERLMVVCNLMNLSGIQPVQVYKWFMEMYVDSSDWVMAPNVMGMGLFSDGGIFATKPYICGSSYILKMSDYPKGEWCEVMDGLYWKFIQDHKDFFLKNYRLAMMAKLLEKMDSVRKKRIFSKADEFIHQNTN